ncbi:unnamed protein product [Spirodela intermedia]|uniref:Uncharacterized protein n=1 Tax=Spirodela intermedia TaxID=51605 RepID=A0A7I8LMN4_SPIIN|nr:unnamed protein product [Spirodela intermedia]
MKTERERESPSSTSGLSVLALVQDHQASISREDAGGLGGLRPVLVELADDEEEDEVNAVEDGEEGVVVVQAGGVEVVEDPPPVAVPPGEARHAGEEDTTEEVPHAERGHRVGGPQALHALWGLVVEELYLRHLQEGVGNPHEDELRQEDEDGEGNLAAGLHHAAGPRDRQPPALCHGHDDDVQDEADADSLQEGDPPRVPGPPPHDRDEVAVVEGDRDEHGQGNKDRQAGGGDLEVRPHSPVKRHALLDEEGVYLRQHDAGYERREQNWDHPEDLLRLLHLRHCGQRPHRRRPRPHRGFVQQPNQ